MRGTETERYLRYFCLFRVKHMFSQVVKQAKLALYQQHTGSKVPCILSSPRQTNSVVRAFISTNIHFGWDAPLFLVTSNVYMQRINVTVMVTEYL